MHGHYDESAICERAGVKTGQWCKRICSALDMIWIQAVFNISHSSQLPFFLVYGKGEVDDPNEPRSWVCLSLQVHDCNAALMIIMHIHLRWYLGMRTKALKSNTETALGEQIRCIFINKANLLKKETLTKDSGWKTNHNGIRTPQLTQSTTTPTLLFTERATIPPHSHTTENHRLSLLHHPLQGRTSPSLFIHPRPMSKAAAAAGRRRGQSSGWRKQRDRPTPTDVTNTF